MALVDVEQETCQPETNKETMAEVIDSMFRYGDGYLYEEHREVAKKNMIWNEDKSKEKGAWACDVHFMFRLGERAFYVDGTRHMYEIEDEHKNDEWGWMSGYNWSCNISWCDDKRWKEFKKCLIKWGETPYGTSPDKFDHPFEFNLMDFYTQERKEERELLEEENKNEC